MTSPYHQSAANLRENGYHVMPVGPGTKFPGEHKNDTWQPMAGWQKYCVAMPPEFVHDRWEDWPDAGVCVAHGNIIGLDLDTDRQDVAEALHRAVAPPNVRRRGAKGWMGYFRPGPDLSEIGLVARVRWYEKGSDSKSPLVELLLDGTQSVLPPTIHPGTNAPYTWTTPSTLEDTDISDLPEMSRSDFEALDREFGKIGLTRQAPRQVGGNLIQFALPSAHDLEKPFGRALNDRAMEPGAIDQWFPALGLPKARQRGRSGFWEGVPWWRASNGGRAVHDRNPNLRISPAGIVDFGADRSYTPADLVCAARDCSFAAAAEWLGQYIRPEEVIRMDVAAPAAKTAPLKTEPHKETARDVSNWIATPVFPGTRSYSAIQPVAEPTEAEWNVMMPGEVPPFPVPDYSVCEGLLGDVARAIDAASATATEAGALAVAIPLLGAVFGQGYATPTGLRSNVYTVALGGSGTGKTSLVSPAKELLTMGQAFDLIGSDRFVSGSGLLQMLNQGPCRISFLDEFGHMLQQIGSPGSGAHAKQILTEITALYSAAGTVFTGAAYADGRDRAISYPHLCLFGMATPDQFWRAFGSASMEDGSVARYLVFPLGETGGKDVDKSVMQAVADRIIDVKQTMAGRSRGNLGNTQAMTVPLDDYAEKARAALKHKESAFATYAENNGVKGGGAILRRVTENALKIALISAVGRDPVSPEIDSRDMDIGHALAWWSANVMINSIAAHVADNQTERNVNEVERKIRAAGEAGIMKGVLKDRCRNIPRREFDEIIDSLADADVIEKVVVQTAKKPGTMLRMSG